jgi:prepilin-type N-terminal cleavage/methylation domain-containing protein
MYTDRGFSFLEVLVVTAIFGILAVIAVPQYSVYRERGYAASAAHDLRNVAAAEEALFAQTGRYQAVSACTASPSTRCEVSNLPGVSALSKGIILEVSATAHGFSGTARHANSATTCRWDSTQGGMLGCSSVK